MKKRACKNPDCNEYVDYWGQKMYCSNQCRQHAYRLRKGQDKLSEIWVQQSTKHQCLNCGRVFWSAYKRAKFCKTSCRVSHFQQMKRLKVQDE